MTIELDLSEEETKNIEKGGFITLLIGGMRIVIMAEKNGGKING